MVDSRQSVLNSTSIDFCISLDKLCASLHSDPSKMLTTHFVCILALAVGAIATPLRTTDYGGTVTALGEKNTDYAGTITALDGPSTDASR